MGQWVLDSIDVSAFFEDGFYKQIRKGKRKKHNPYQMDAKQKKKQPTKTSSSQASVGILASSWAWASFWPLASVLWPAPSIPPSVQPSPRRSPGPNMMNFKLISS